MKIMFYLSSLDFGGTERTVSYLSDYLVKMNNEVLIVINNNVISYKINEKVRIIAFDFGNSKKIIKRISNVIRRRNKLKKIINDYEPDIILTMSAVSLFYIQSINHRSKTIVSERGNPYQASFLMKFIKRLTFSKASGVIFQTYGASMFYKQTKQQRRIIIPNAVGNESLYNLNNDFNYNKNILAVGRLIKGKDYPTMIRGFKKFAEKTNGYKLLIYGKGPEKTNLQNLTKKLGIEKNVKFMGVNIKAIEENINSACFIFTSKREGMPNSLMEAMAVGIPSISTDCDFGPSDLIDQKINGILIPVGDVDKLAESLNEIISNRELALKISKNGKNLMKRFSIDEISSRYLKFIEEVTYEIN